MSDSRVGVSDVCVLELPGGVPLELRRIPEGSFRMGQRGGNPEEEPLHRVTIPADFYLGVTPVTQAQYRAMADACRAELVAIPGSRGPEPSHFTGDDRPVEQVSWDEARCVCRWLSGSGLLPPGWAADLPSEAQWEYACRAGTETKYWSGDREADLARVGWYGGNAGGETHPVGAFGGTGANPWGLHDLHGNVWEWCLDSYDLRRYRKMIEYAEPKPLLDPAAIEFDPADPTIVAIAEMLARFAAGRLELEPGDGTALKAYRTLAEDYVENGNDQWKDDIQAAKTAIDEGKWPEKAQSVAAGTQPAFQNAVDAATDRDSPARVLRGGAWNNTATNCRAASRGRLAPGFRVRNYGFRLAVVPGSGETSQTGAERRDGGGASRDGAATPESGRGAGGRRKRSAKR